MDAARMWNLIADLIETYANEGDVSKALDALRRAVTTEPMWIPQALFDPRTKAVRHEDEFKRLTALPEADGPAHFNAAAVALEHDEVDSAMKYLRKAFEIAEEDGSVPFLIEAVQSDAAFAPHMGHSRLSELIEGRR